MCIIFYPEPPSNEKSSDNPPMMTLTYLTCPHLYIGTEGTKTCWADQDDGSFLAPSRSSRSHPVCLTVNPLTIFKLSKSCLQAFFVQSKLLSELKIFVLLLMKFPNREIVHD